MFYGFGSAMELLTTVTVLSQVNATAFALNSSICSRREQRIYISQAELKELNYD